MNKSIIAEGNYCKRSYFTVNGTAEFTIGVCDMGEDECRIEYSDGLYKLIKNNQLICAATQVLIHVVNKC